MALLLADRDAELPEEKKNTHATGYSSHLKTLCMCPRSEMAQSHFHISAPQCLRVCVRVCFCARFLAYVVDCQNNDPLYAPLSC